MSSPPFTLNFTNSSYQYINNYYIITFPNNNATSVDATGSITFTQSLDVSIICVAGGGAGGGAGGTNRYGGGGAGGGNFKITSVIYSGDILNIVVGYGGKGASNADGGQGTASSVSRSSTILIQCSGGEGGLTSSSLVARAQDGQLTAGWSGTVGTGGVGGRNISDISGITGQNSWGTISLPSEISSYVNNRYGGGGAGSYDNSATPVVIGGGGAGDYGIGADYFYNTKFPPLRGEDATTPGSGGGGSAVSGSNISGGNGANGIVIMYINMNAQILPANVNFYQAGWTTTETAYDVSYNNVSSVISGTQQSSLDLSYQMKPGVMMIDGTFGGASNIYRIYCSVAELTYMGAPSNVDDAYLVYPGYGFKLYAASDYTNTASRLYYNTTNQIVIFDLTGNWVTGLTNNVPVVRVKDEIDNNYTQNQTNSIRIYYRGAELKGPFSFSE